jgi:hypothetical protein
MDPELKVVVVLRVCLVLSSKERGEERRGGDVSPPSP